MGFLEQLSQRRRFGMKMGLDSIKRLLQRLGDPQLRFNAVHVAGTNGKGAVSAIIDSALRAQADRGLIGRYTSPHLISINERFTIEGTEVDDETLESTAAEVERAMESDTTFFEALTAVAFKLFADRTVDTAVLECGLGGRLDATNVCKKVVSVITRIGLDHCDWLGRTLPEIAMEKSGIIKGRVPVVLGKNEDEVVETVERCARDLGSPFYYAPEIVSDADIPQDFSLSGDFNRENAQTALAALKVMGKGPEVLKGFSKVFWPGRFQRAGRVIIDGAHNPPAAQALARELEKICIKSGKVSLIAGFCGDKDVEQVLRILSGYVAKGYAVKINNPRSLSSKELASKMKSAGIEAEESESLSQALEMAKSRSDGLILVCGSLFLAGEALAEAGLIKSGRFDPSETLKSFLL